MIESINPGIDEEKNVFRDGQYRKRGAVNPISGGSIPPPYNVW